MGIAAAEAGDPEFADNEWRKFGYQQQKAFLAGERLSTQFTHDAATRDLRGDSFSRWANNWWKKANEENFYTQYLKILNFKYCIFFEN